MSVEWTANTLGEVADITKLAGYEFTKHIEYNDGEIIALRSLNVTDGQLDLTNIKRISRNVSNALPRSKLFTNDILLTYTGSKLGDTALIDADDKYHLAPNVCRLRANKEKDSYYVYVYLRSKAFAKSLDTYKVGSGQPTVPMKNIRVIPIPWPPIDAREKIGLIYRSLNDKIEHNRKMNQTLEAMAQALFKSWFVDFDPVHAKVNSASDADYDQIAKELGISRKVLDLFPDEFEESELGMIPKGWEVKALDNVAHYQNGLALQKHRPLDENHFLPVLKIAQLRKGYADGEEKADPAIKPECIVNSGDVVFSWSGSLVVDVWCGGKVALNQHLFKVTSDKYSKWFYYYWTKQHLMSFQQIAADKAVTMGHIKKSHLAEALCVVPDDEVFSKAEDIISPLLDKLIMNKLEIFSLQKTRDTLLPKLLSGEVDVSELELDNVTH